MWKIPFNKPYISGNELRYIKEAADSGKISGDGIFTKKCERYFERNFKFEKALLTTSCTDALEMSAILINIREDDEVIVPSFTFVSTANAFIMRGARIVFADSERDTPNIDADALELLITKKTKAVCVVHYAGIACKMDRILAVARKHGIYVIEDAAHALNAYYKGDRLGSLGHLAAFSFHETKNIMCGEGGMLAINDGRFRKRAEIIREKGTNRAAFFRNEVSKYSWVDIGSSFLPSDITAAFLWGQLENIDKIQTKRRKIWEMYYEGLKPLEKSGNVKLPFIPGYATQNYHIFYLLCNDRTERDSLLNELKRKGILAVSHYLPLHESPYYRLKHDGRRLPNARKYSERLARLPLYYELTDQDIEKMIRLIKKFFSR